MMQSFRTGPRLWLSLAALVLVLAAVPASHLWVRSSAAATPRPAAPPVPVLIGRAKEEDVAVYTSGIGTVTPLASVQIKVRVDGELQRIAFVEGQDVKAGDLLAQIDPRPFRAALDLARAQKARDEAQLANALLDRDRYDTLLKQDSIQRQTFDTQVALVRQLQATVQADQAAIDTAQVNLDYTTIRSPVDGRTGVRLIDAGNIVHASDQTGLVVVNRIDPIAVLFTLPEGEFPRISAAMRAGGRVPLAVRALARGDARLLATGKLLLVNNQIDTASGTVQLKAEFPNPGHTLWPGQYVNVQLVLGARTRAVTVEAAAVQRGPDGLFAYVVKEDDSVGMQPVQVGLVQDGRAIVEQGLAAGTRVVVDGHYKLRPGSKVVDARAARPAGGPPAAGAGGAGPVPAAGPASAGGAPAATPPAPGGERPGAGR